MQSNLNFKSYLINSGIYDFYKSLINYHNLYGLLLEYGYIPPSEVTPYFFADFSIFLSDTVIKECRRIFDAERSRVSRVRKRVSRMIEHECIFLTLTFNDDTLLNTNSSTRRTYVTRFLTQFNVPVIANKDFGKKNGREHYHALIQIDHIDYSLYTLGSLNGKKVVVGKSSDVRISKYIAKLTNHAIKETTKHGKIIYLHMDKLF